MQREGDRGVEDSRFSYLAKSQSGGAGLLKHIGLLNLDGLKGDGVLSRSKLSCLVIGGAGAELKSLI